MAYGQYATSCDPLKVVFKDGWLLILLVGHDQFHYLISYRRERDLIRFVIKIEPLELKFLVIEH